MYEVMVHLLSGGQPGPVSPGREPPKTAHFQHCLRIRTNVSHQRPLQKNASFLVDIIAGYPLSLSPPEPIAASKKAGLSR